jgi:hypothetical protein
MKNLMIYISPTGSFDNDHPSLTSNDAGQLIKIQIENSLALGWKIEDILLFTNFDFEYGTVKSIVLKDVEFFNRKPQASKINAIVKLFEDKIIKEAELYWFHDIDAFQLEPISEDELELTEAEADMGLTDYGSWTRWNTGSVFFKKASEDIFGQIKTVMYQKNIDEEKALGFITETNPNINQRVKKLNKTYNFTPFNIRSCYQKSTKPLKVVHFHPNGRLRRLGYKRTLDIYLGDNSLGRSLLTDRLIKIFKYHRIR